jgi:cobaltochelatase CobN
MYVSNLRKKDQVKAQSLDEFVNQEMRSRYFHPRWIKAMQDSGYAGATAILDRMNNMWGWEVMTPEAIRDDQWQEFFDVYVEDKYDMDMREFFEEHNAESLAQIIERMLEAARKGYWNTDAETLKKLVETYIDIATVFDVATDNDKFNEYMDVNAAGFGLTPLSQALVQANIAPETASASTQMEQVTGQQLQEQVKAESVDTDHTPIYLLSLLVLFGAVSQWLERAPKNKAHYEVQSRPALDKAA